MPPASLMRFGQADRHALPGAAEMRRHLLGPFERRVERPRPRHRHVRIGLGRTPGVVDLHLLRDRDIENAVVGGHLVRRADGGAFGAGAVVAADVDDQRVVELAHVLDGLDHPADLMVGVGNVGGEHLRLPREQLLLVGGQRVPLRQVVGPGRELRVRRDHAEPLLVGEDLLAQFVPAHVELALELVDPLLRRLVRRMGAAGHVVDEERLVGRGGIELSHVLDRLVRHVGGQVVAGLADPGEDLGGVLEQVRRPLVGLAAHEAVEVVEAHADGPLVEGPGRAVLIARRVVVLAEPGRGVAVLLQDLADGGVVRPMTES